MALPPASVLAYVQAKIPGLRDFEAPRRLYRLTDNGFHLLRGAYMSRPKGEFVAAVHVSVTSEDGGSRLDVTYAGTLALGLIMFAPVSCGVYAALMLIRGLSDADDPGALPFGLALLALLVGICWPFVTNHREREVHFAELADALERLMALAEIERARAALVGPGPAVDGSELSSAGGMSPSR